jgi:hypothetical protein
VELTVSYIYSSMAAFFDRDNVGLPGFSAYFRESRWGQGDWGGVGRRWRRKRPEGAWQEGCGWKGEEESAACSACL